MTTIVYHSADFDGLFCREIARKFFSEQRPAESFNLIGWNHGDAPLPDSLLAGPLIVMDLPLLSPFGLEERAGWICKIGGDEVQPVDRWDSSNVVWIDHHGTSIESHPKNIPGYRIDGVAACRLAWQWFSHMAQGFDPHLNQLDPALPIKQEYIDRSVPEPLAVRLAGEYDIWDRRDERAEQFQHGLKVELPDFGPLLLTGLPGKEATLKIVDAGKIIQKFTRSENEWVVTKRSFLTEFMGLKFLAMNTNRCNSLSFTARDIPETGHDALLAFYFQNGVWNFSMYHARHRTDLDLSKIAKSFPGGGGHKGACGFTLKDAHEIPFLWETAHVGLTSPPGTAAPIDPDPVKEAPAPAAVPDPEPKPEPVASDPVFPDNSPAPEATPEPEPDPVPATPARKKSKVQAPDPRQD